MDEKRYYDEKEETKQIPLVCAHCRQENTYPVRYVVRTKKAQIPPGGNEEDRAKFAKARSYMVRVDNMVACRNIRCRKRFELTGQSVFLISSSLPAIYQFVKILRRSSNRIPFALVMASKRWCGGFAVQNFADLLSQGS